jgi:murein DD-endopeptidase MepM/ murein hydrolase activator NlpD
MMGDELGQHITTRDDRSAPIDGARIAAPTEWRGYGAVRDPTTREPAGHVHAGVDVAGVAGTPVLAPEAGVVEEVGTLPMRPPWTGYAPAVLMRGDSGRYHLLAHLSGNESGGAASAPLVHAGDRVTLRQVLGYTGHERHTHWEVRTRAHARALRGETTMTITLDPGAWLRGEDTPAPAGPHSPPLDPRRGQPRRVRRRVLVVETEDLERYWHWSPLPGRGAVDVGVFADE